MKIILASASPRRRELLEQIGIEFEVRVSHVEEKITATEPEKIVEELSCQKAQAVYEAVCGGVAGTSAGEMQAVAGVGESEGKLLIIGADTVVAADGEILGKPADEAEAKRMLQKLSGRTHQVYTGVTLVYRAADGSVIEKSFHEKTSVTFYPVTDAEIAEYVATGDCLDKAGAYGIQGFCARYINGIEGDYNNVVGLPAGRLYQEIKEWIR